MKYLFAIFLASTFFVSYSQSKPKTKVATDTVLTHLLKHIPQPLHDVLLKEYKSMSAEQKKELLEVTDFFASMPQSSKKQLIQNIDTNYSNVAALKKYFLTLVPKNYSIYIEFKPADKILRLDESVDFWVFKKSGDSLEFSVPVFQEWDVQIKSKKLDSLLSLTPLKRDDLLTLKSYMIKANCISIGNQNICEIGFARSGMGKYSYLIFDEPLNDIEKKNYNNDCAYIFYKDNIVLEYGGGAIGPQCFPDAD